MKKEIYEDVLKEEPQDTLSKEYEKWEKRLHKSIGWIELMEQGIVFVNDKNKPSSSIMNKKIVYDVELDEDGSFTCNRQIDAEILSLLAQMNERLKRLEQNARNNNCSQP